MLLSNLSTFAKTKLTGGRLRSAVYFSANLGDGTHTNHYYPISEYLVKNPGTKKEYKNAISSEKEAQKSPGEIKPYSAGIRETEFSHLVDAIAKANALKGATLYNLLGLAIAGSFGDLTLNEATLTKLKKCVGSEVFILKSYCKNTKKSMNCTEPALKKNWLCVDNLISFCKNPMFTVYRCILDHKKLPYKKTVVGYSAVTFDQTLFDYLDSFK